jgi:putative transposase
MRRYQRRQGEARQERKPIHVELEIDVDRFEGMITKGLQGVAVEIGLEVAESLMADEVERRCGLKRRRDPKRKAYRYGRQRGSILFGGQRVGVSRPRMRWIRGGEVELQTYQRLQKEPGEGAVMRRLVRGVSCRDYRSVVDAIRQGWGISAAAVSRSFVKASTARVRELAERQFVGVRFVAILIDGVAFAGQTVIAALGVTDRGEKRILAQRHGATENAQACIDLLTDLRLRGVSTDDRTLFVIDGSKALRTAISNVWGEQALVQRCRVHKLRNVKGYVSEADWPEVKRRIQKAYADTNLHRATKSLQATAGWLEWINPHAAASLREGLAETLTVTALGLTGPIYRSLATTNMIESIFTRARMMTCRVKRWRPGSMRQRWCATALLHAERGFHRIYGHADIATQLIPRLDANAALATQSA